MLVLQIGTRDWSPGLRLPDDVEWHFLDVGDPNAADYLTVKTVEVTVAEAPCRAEVLARLDPLISPHTFLFTENAEPPRDTPEAHWYLRKAARHVDASDRQALVEKLARTYYRRQFGQKVPSNSLLVSPLWPSPPTYLGNTGLSLPVDTAVMRPAVSWRQSIRYENDRDMDLWLEYQADGDVEVELTAQLTKAGTSDVISWQRTFTATDMEQPVRVFHPDSGYLACSLSARGTGTLRIGQLHYRHSRHGEGHFIAGGRRLVDANREELFYYYHPGNLQPPLNIYFAGYRPAEGFEGLGVMTGLGHPFLVITDPRLEGGRFYLGSAELEVQLHQVIRDLMAELGFTEQDLIFSGLSMGAFGALYHGSQFDAQAIIAGKPIIDLPYVARQTRLTRPGEFLTVLDLINFWQQRADGDGTPEGFTAALLQRWRSAECLKHTKVLLAYMLQDDYDDQAYHTLLTSQAGKPTEVVARGYQGRHNDDSPSIVAWFVGQYQRVIAEYREQHHG
ncbi:MAG: accessory Sec system protein Asp2 [Promicromonosporaceae bacterium]|nr:accessory Sec system protein Asp2 [Promicromonosporaceae bacterium]